MNNSMNKNLTGRMKEGWCELKSKLGSVMPLSKLKEEAIEAFADALKKNYVELGEKIRKDFIASKLNGKIR